MRPCTVRTAIAAVLLVTSLGHGAYQDKSTDEIVRAAENACVYLYPLALTHVVWLSRGGYTNELRHARTYPSAEQSRGAIAPNVDTLYSEAWLDLSDGPVVLEVPDTNGRYYVVQLVDGFDQTIGLIGKRKTGTPAAKFLIAGPRSKNAGLPEATRFDVLTNFVWLLLRIQTNGRADYASVNALQDQFSVKPIMPPSADTRPPTLPAVDRHSAPVRQLEAMDGIMFFRVAAEALKRSPPVPADPLLIRDLARIGISPGQSFSQDGLTAGLQSAINRGVLAGRRKIVSFGSDTPAMFAEAVGGGWRRHKVEHFGKDYLRRAVTARLTRGSLPPEEATYFVARTDSEGRPLGSQHRYVLRFAPGKLPPVDAFWSITLYDSEGHFIANPMDRYALGDRDALAKSSDGGLELYIQAEPPAGKESNWLPAPRSAVFWLSLRLYGPGKDVLDGMWKAPPVRRVE